MKNIYITGEVVDIETLARLRPWIEDEARKKYGNFGKTQLLTDYDKDRNVFRFKIGV